MSNTHRATHYLLPILASAVLGGCSFISPTPAIMGEQTLCTNYLMYEMCAHDSDQDRITDYFYFGDDDRVFLVRQGFKPHTRPLHPCAQTMSPRLQATANDTLDPAIQANRQAASEVKQRLIGGYLALLPKITLCNARLGRGPESADDFLAD